MQSLQIVLIVLMAVAVLLLAGAFVAIALAVVRIGRLGEGISKFVSVAQDEVVPVARDARSALASVDRLASKVTETVERIDHIAAEAERVMDGAYVAEVAGKVAKSSATGLVSVYEGLKQGIRTLRGSKEAVKGGSSDEQ